MDHRVCTVVFKMKEVYYYNTQLFWDNIQECFIIFAALEDVMGLAPPSPNLEDLLTDKVDKAKEKEEENKLSPKITIMKPILRFIQLLCENHNLYLQNLLRDQNNKTKYNLISETLILLDVICGSTTGGLGLLGLYINEGNVVLINQILETLTEFCQVKIYLYLDQSNSIKKFISFWHF